MDVRKLERGVKFRGMDVADKAIYRNMAIFVADGYRKSSPECPEPHYFTFFAVGRDTEKVDIGSFAIYPALKDPLGWASKKKERVAEAVEHAKRLIDMCTRQQEYNG